MNSELEKLSAFANISEQKFNNFINFLNNMSDRDLFKLGSLLSAVDIYTTENGNYIKFKNNTFIDVNGSLVTKAGDFNVVLADTIHFNPDLEFNNTDDFLTLERNLEQGNKKALEKIANSCDCNTHQSH